MYSEYADSPIWITKLLESLINPRSSGYIQYCVIEQYVDMIPNSTCNSLPLSQDIFGALYVRLLIMQCLFLVGGVWLT